MNPEEIAAAFGILRSSGKVRDFGVSNFSVTQFDLISKYFPQLVTNQVEVSLTETKAFYDGTIDQMMMKKLQPMAWSVMGSYFAEDSERIARIKLVLGWNRGRKLLLYVVWLEHSNHTTFSFSQRRILV
jgi:predicted oxidoreductase